MQRVQSGQRLNIKASTWNALIDAAEAHSRSGRSGASQQHNRDGAFAFGRLNQAVTAGVLTGKSMALWMGPAWGEDDAATGGQWPIHYAVVDMSDDTYVVGTWCGGKCYVQPFACGGSDPV